MAARGARRRETARRGRGRGLSCGGRFDIIIYFAKPEGEFLARWVGDARAVVSVVTQIEAFGFQDISEEEAAAIDSALETLPSIPVSDAVTRNVNDFNHVSGLVLINPFAIETDPVNGF